MRGWRSPSLDLDWLRVQRLVSAFLLRRDIGVERVLPVPGMAMISGMSAR